MTNKILDMLQQSGSHGGGGRKARYQVIDEFYHRNLNTGYDTYRVPTTYLNVGRGVKFRIPTSLLSSENTVRLKMKLFPRQGFKAEYFLKLQRQAGDLKGFAENYRKLYGEYPDVKR